MAKSVSFGSVDPETGHCLVVVPTDAVEGVPFEFIVDGKERYNFPCPKGVQGSVIRVNLPKVTSKTAATPEVPEEKSATDKRKRKEEKEDNEQELLQKKSKESAGKEKEKVLQEAASASVSTTKPTSSTPAPSDDNSAVDDEI